MNTRQAFTLVELLIVVAIIGILSAIALPNYRNATIKSHVVKAKMDLRTLSVGLESYRLDNSKFPRKNSDVLFFTYYLMPDLTTPVAYVSNPNVIDPFGPVEEYEEVRQAPGFDEEGFTTKQLPLIKNSYTYVPYASLSRIHGRPEIHKEGFALVSVGPDRQDSFIVDYPFPEYYRFPGETVRDSIYNPSNGIDSFGDIGYFGGDIRASGLIGG